MNRPAPRQLKPHSSFQEQLALLSARGLHIGDEAAALASLERLGYYRLSGYFYPLRRTKPAGERGRLDTFVDGATFELVTELAEFDKRLRLLAMSALETIEVALRVAVAHRLGRVNVEAHRCPDLLDGRFASPSRGGGPSLHSQWLRRFDELCLKSKDDFMDHHRQAYGGRVPIWVGIEVWDFGLLSRFFSGLKHRDKSAIALAFGVPDGDVLRSWIRSFNFVRNVAAHHARLWNRVNTEIPALPPLERCRWLEPLHQDEEARRKLFGALTCMRFLLKTMAPASSWHSLLKAHVATFPRTDLLSMRAAGFPDGWEQQPVWN